MMRSIYASILPLLITAASVEAATVPDRVTLYTPVFQGPKELGQSVATVLNLQLWETLQARRSSKGPSFGLGVVVWGRPLDEYSHQQAEHRAKDIALLAQLVFWGKVYEYGDGAVAETNLSVPRYEDFRRVHPERWIIQLQLSEGDARFEADIPQRRYSFRPLVLSKDIVARYSQPMALEIRERRDGGAVIGHVGTEFTRISQVGDEVEVTSEGKHGWVQLPKLSEQRGEAVNFVAGVVRALRGDWQGVEELMNLVASNPDTPNELRTDAYLYVGLAQEKQGKQAQDSLTTALSLSPNARRCVVYSEMEALAQFGRRRNAHASLTELETLLERAKNLITANRTLFPASDPWPEEVLRRIERLSREP